MPKDPNYYVKDSAIADIFNIPTGNRLVERYENFIGLMSALGIQTYSTIMGKLKAASQSDGLLEEFILALRTDVGINFGDPETQAALNDLVNKGVFEQVEADLLKTLAIKPSSLAYQTVGQPITAVDVSIALRNY
jgi:chemotaxis methyl-accepting protein methylase